MLSDSDLCLRWIDHFIINQNICPFAKKPYENGQIRIEFSNAMTDEEITSVFNNEINILKNIIATICLFMGSE